MRLVLVLMVLIIIAFGTRQTALSKDNESYQRVKVVICKVFKSYCGEALRVSWCESKWKTSAQNGQYLGLFQMGKSERATYGHGPGAWAQARAALRYFIASGRDWSPWTCQYVK